MVGALALALGCGGGCGGGGDGDAEFDCAGWCAGLYEGELVGYCESECADTVPNLQAGFLESLASCIPLLPCDDPMECEFATCYSSAIVGCSGLHADYIAALCEEETRCFGPDTDPAVAECIAALNEIYYNLELNCFTDEAVASYSGCMEQACLPDDDASVNRLDDQCSDQSFGLHGFGDNDQCLFFVYWQ